MVITVIARTNIKFFMFATFKLVIITLKTACSVHRVSVRRLILKIDMVFKL